MVSINIINRLLNTLNISKVKDLFSLGTKFFIIQIAGVLLYETNNIIISQLFGPAEVTPYNIAFKYFNIIMMFFIIVITPFWSAFTEAWIKKEFEWIKSIVQKLLNIWRLIILIVILMLIISPWVYQVWIGEHISIPFGLSALVGLCVLSNCWNGIFSHFLNGIGKIRLQLYMSAFVAFMNIPTAIFLGKELGIIGVLASNLLFALVQAIIAYLQYSRLITQRAIGIWNQ